MTLRGNWPSKVSWIVPFRLTRSLQILVLMFHCPYAMEIFWSAGKFVLAPVELCWSFCSGQGAQTRTLCSQTVPLGVSLEFTASSRGSKTMIAKSAAWGSDIVFRAVSESPMSSAFLVLLPTLPPDRRGFIMMMILFLVSSKNIREITVWGTKGIWDLSLRGPFQRFWVSTVLML